MAGWEAGQPCSKRATSHSGLGSGKLRLQCLTVKKIKINKKYSLVSSN